MVTPDEAAAVVGVSTRTIYRWIEAEKLHFTETAGGLLTICLNSLD
jgi:excisionase family DNA binding protein